MSCLRSQSESQIQDWNPDLSDSIVVRDKVFYSTVRVVKMQIFRMYENKDETEHKRRYKILSCLYRRIRRGGGRERKEKKGEKKEKERGKERKKRKKSKQC